MRRFIHRLLVFASTVIVWMTLMTILNTSLLQRPVTIEAELLIAGDSHGMCGMDPAQFDRAVNVCEGAENYIFTYYKLKKLLRDNPSISRVMLEFSPNNFSSYQDYKLQGPRSKSHLLRYAPVLPPDLPFRIDIHTIKFYNAQFRKYILFPNPDIEFLGGYEKSPSNLNRADVDITLAKHFGTESAPFGLSEYTPMYLDSILRLTTQRDVELLFYRLPHHPEYETGIPSAIANFTDSLQRSLHTRGYRVLDFHGNELPTSHFRDYDHLSESGARSISRLMRDSLD